MSFELIIAIIAIIISLISFVSTISLSHIANLSHMVNVERSLAQVPSVLKKFHDISPEDLNEAGINIEEFAYLLASFTAGSIYHRIYFLCGSKPFKAGDYRHRMCKAPATRKAWRLIKKMMNPSKFIDKIDVTIKEIERA